MKSEVTVGVGVALLKGRRYTGYKSLLPSHKDKTLRSRVKPTAACEQQHSFTCDVGIASLRFVHSYQLHVKTIDLRQSPAHGFSLTGHRPQRRPMSSAVEPPALLSRLLAWHKRIRVAILFSSGLSPRICAVGMESKRRPSSSVGTQIKSCLAECSVKVPAGGKYEETAEQEEGGHR